MHILDESHLLNDAEKNEYYSLLKKYGFEAHDFRLRVGEDQKPMDMNDLNYVIVVKVKATHLRSHITKIYESSAESGIWLAEMEEDLKAGKFKNN